MLSSSICQGLHTSIQLPGTISLFKGYMAGFLLLSQMCETSNGKLKYVLRHSTLVTTERTVSYWCQSYTITFQPFNGLFFSSLQPHRQLENSSLGVSWKTLYYKPQNQSAKEFFFMLFHSQGLKFSRMIDIDNDADVQCTIFEKQLAHNL